MLKCIVHNRQYYIYILSSKSGTVLYTGVTCDLKQRMYQHRNEMMPGFSSRYNATELVYYEYTNNAYSAMSREKQIKAGSRNKKLELINDFNPLWEDLYEHIAD